MIYMPIIDLNKVSKIFVEEIRDNLNLHEKIELLRILINSIEYDHDEILRQEKHGRK